MRGSVGREPALVLDSDDRSGGAEAAGLSSVGSFVGTGETLGAVSVTGAI
jgi:hypothetical protein